MDQPPSWTAAMDSVDHLWNEESSIARSPDTHMTKPYTGSSVDNDTVYWRGSSNITRCMPAAAPSDSMWDPIPNAPQHIRSQVLDLFSVATTTPVNTEPAQLDVSQSAPGASECTSTADPESRKQRDASTLSRTRSYGTNTAEQKQANARESQKRFRLRQKVLLTSQNARKYALPDAHELRCMQGLDRSSGVLIQHLLCKQTYCTLQARSQAIEAQLAGTVAELCKLRVRQQQLESRNLVLEKCSRLNHRQHEDQLTEVSTAFLRFNQLVHLCAKFSS